MSSQNSPILIIRIVFIVVEGNDAAGKTTLVRSIANFLKSQKFSTFSTFEPGAGVREDPIRKLLLRHNNLSATQELLYFLLSRVENATKISHSLLSNDVVISDRYYYSSVVYQGYIPNHFSHRYQVKDTEILTMAKVLKINHILFPRPTPKLVFFLLTPPKLSLLRLKKENRHPNVSDDFRFDYHNAAYNGYCALFKQLRAHPESSLFRYHLIDGALSQKEIFAKVRDVVMKHLSREH